MKWQIVPEHRGEFMKRSFANARRPTIPRTSSQPTSPSRERPSSGAFERTFLDSKPLDNPFSTRFPLSAARKEPYVRGSPGSSSPPSAKPADRFAATPDRSNMFRSGLHPPSSPSGFLMNGLSPFPDLSRNRNANGLNEIAAARTPGALAFQPHSDYGDNLATPMIGKHFPKLAPPSTARLPSHYMPLSSPAPFWKFTAEYNSSPQKQPQSSPVKAEHGDAEEGQTEGQVPRPDPEIRSSSPPPADGEVGMGSPTRALSSRGRDTSQPQTSSQQRSTRQSPQRQPSVPKQPTPSLQTSAFKPAPTNGQETEDEEEEGMNFIDLAKGFQPIGSFHRSMNAGAIRGV